MTSAGAATVDIQLCQSANADLSTPTVLASTGAVAKGTLIAGYRVTFKLPTKITARYLGFQVTIQELLNREDSFFFLFGEIHCRIHIYNKSQETKVPEYLLVTNTVYCYVSYVATLKKTADVSIMAVHPQGVQDNYFNYPFYADRKHRQQITDLFNNWLQDICSDDRVPFIDIWYNQREFERPLWNTQDFKEDLCHIKNSGAIKRLEDFLENR